MSFPGSGLMSIFLLIPPCAHPHTSESVHAQPHDRNPLSKWQNHGRSREHHLLWGDLGTQDLSSCLHVACGVLVAVALATCPATVVAVWSAGSFWRTESTRTCTSTCNGRWAQARSCHMARRVRVKQSPLSQIRVADLARFQYQ